MRPLLVILFLVLAACTPAPRRSPAESIPDALHVSGQVRGYLEPCGCNRPQLGGIPRRATALGGAPFVENGSLVAGPGRLSELKFETLLVALSETGCLALNIGAGEIALGLDYVRSSRGLARFPFISANVLDDRGEPAFAPGAALGVGREKWWVIGLIDPASARGQSLAPSRESLLRALAARPRDTDRILLLYHGPRKAAEAVARAAPERIHFVVCNSSDGEARVHSPTLITPGDRGRRLVRLSPAPRILTLGEEYGDDPRMTARLREYVGRIAEEDLLHRMNPQTEPSAGGYIGDAACIRCHGDAGAVQGATRHARAIGSLRRTGREVDPDCIACHVVGYGERTGYMDLAGTPGLAMVGCESCHGPGHEHAASPEKRKTVGDAKASCHRCHTEDTDPGFRFREKWARIRHR